MKRVDDQNKKKFQVNVWFTELEYLKLRKIASRRNMQNIDNPRTRQENTSTLVREGVLDFILRDEIAHRLTESGELSS